MAKRAYNDVELKFLRNYKKQTLIICVIEVVIFVLLEFVLQTSLLSTFELVCLCIVVPVAFYTIRYRLAFGVGDAELGITLVAGIVCSINLGMSNGISLITAIILLPMWAIVIATAYAYRARKG